MTTQPPNRQDAATIDTVELHTEKYARATQLLTDTVKTLIGSQEFDTDQKQRLAALKEKLFEAADLLIYAAEDVGKMTAERTDSKEVTSSTVTINGELVELTKDELLILSELTANGGEPLHPGDIYTVDGFHDDASTSAKRQAFSHAIKGLTDMKRLSSGKPLVIGEGKTRGRTYRIAPGNTIIIDTQSPSDIIKPTVLEALTPKWSDIFTAIIDRTTKPYITLAEINATAFHGNPSDKDFHALKQALASEKRLAYVGDGAYQVEGRSADGNEWINDDELVSYIDAAITAAYATDAKTVHITELIRDLRKSTTFLVRAEKVRLEQLLTQDRRIATVSGNIFILAPKPAAPGITPSSVAQFTRPE